MSHENREKSFVIEHSSASSLKSNQDETHRAEFLKVAKLDKNKKFFYRFGNENPGLVIGNENCGGAEEFAPKYIGWLWKVDSVGILALKTPCIPKDILKQLEETMKKLLNPLCDENSSKNSKCDSEESDESSSNNPRKFSLEKENSTTNLQDQRKTSISGSLPEAKVPGQLEIEKLPLCDAQTQYDLNDFDSNDKAALESTIEASKSISREPEEILPKISSQTKINETTGEAMKAKEAGLYTNESTDELQPAVTESQQVTRNDSTTDENARNENRVNQKIKRSSPNKTSSKKASVNRPSKEVNRGSFKKPLKSDSTKHVNFRFHLKLLNLLFCFLFPDRNQGRLPAISIKLPPFTSLDIPPIIAPPTTTNPVKSIAPTLTFAIGMP